MSTIKNGGLDQCGAEPYEQQQFRTADVERVNVDPSTVITTSRDDLGERGVTEMRDTYG